MAILPTTIRSMVNQLFRANANTSSLPPEVAFNKIFTSHKPEDKSTKLSTSSSASQGNSLAASSWTNTVREVVPLVGIITGRLCLAYGIVYVFWEYGVEITVCEGL